MFSSVEYLLSGLYSGNNLLQSLLMFEFGVLFGYDSLLPVDIIQKAYLFSPFC